MRISKTIETDTGHRVPSHGGHCRHLHGHRYAITATVEGTIDTVDGSPEEGMVTDFAFLKDLLMKHVHAVMDHHFLIYRNDLHLFERMFDQLVEELGIVWFPVVPTAENIALWVGETLRPHMPSGVTLCEIQVRETPTSTARAVLTDGVWELATIRIPADPRCPVCGRRLTYPRVCEVCLEGVCETCGSITPVGDERLFTCQKCLADQHPDTRGVRTDLPG
jgi:6-pyruvoyltetrahydropterin/6-carboxytetrahydropterin synthase